MTTINTTTASQASTPGDGKQLKTTTTSSPPAVPAVGGGSAASSPHDPFMTDKYASDWMTGKNTSTSQRVAEWMQAPRADQHDTSPGPRTPATGRPSPSTSAHRTDQPGLCNADILKYVTVRFRAAEDHFGDVLFHVLAHVASFNSCAFTIIGRHYRATDNIGALRDLMMVKGFTGADITPASVLDEYARVNQLQAQVGLKLWSASFDLKISELEDCIFLMRKSAADLNTAIARLFTNFCPLLERPRVTEAEAKCAMKPIRQRVKDQADGATIWVCEHEVKSAITNLIYVFTPEL